MKVGFSILKEIYDQHFLPTASDYGLNQREFENFIFFLESEGYVERVLRVNDQFSIKAARLTEKGKLFLKCHHEYLGEYPERSKLKQWVQSEKRQYSNGAKASSE